MFLGGDQSSWRGSGVVRLALIRSGGTWGGLASTHIATCAPSCPSPTGSPARQPGLVPGPLALAPGPAADGFLFLPGVAGAGSSFPSPQLPSRPLIHRQTHTVSLSPRF